MVGWAALADVLDDDETREALAGTVDQMLVDAAGINSDTHLHDRVILVASLAFTTGAINRYVTWKTVAVEGVGVEDFIVAASVALRLVAILNLHCWFAVQAALEAEGCYYKE